MNRSRVFVLGYWIIPFLLFSIQLIYTLQSRNYLRYEEYAESIRNVYWLENGLLYDGISSNVGWYGILLLLYKLFGFSIYSAKYFRLVLSLFSLLFLAKLLQNLFGRRVGTIPLLCYGLSPTLVYFNTLQTSFGMDLQILPIILYLVTKIESERKYHQALLTIIIATIYMLTAMSYPTILFFGPTLLLLLVYKLTAGFTGFNGSSLLICLWSFGGPIILVLLNFCAYLKKPEMLFFDDRTNSGLFRGGGALKFEIDNFKDNVAGLYQDLFGIPSSYYYDVAKGEFFSVSYIVFVVLIISVASSLGSKNRIFSIIGLINVFTLIFCFFAANFTYDMTGSPGIRRNTIFLFSFYAVFTLGWASFFEEIGAIKKNSIVKVSMPAFRLCLTVLFLIIPIHHCFVLFENYKNMDTVETDIFRLIFSEQKERPDVSFNRLRSIIASEDLKLHWGDDTKPHFGSYGEHFALIAGDCYWNNRLCHNLWGYDEKSDEFIPLSFDLWESYYWEH